MSLASNVSFAFNAATLTALGIIVTSVATAIVRIVTVKGKFRAQAADVLIDTALHERLVKESVMRQNIDLRSALSGLVQVVDFNDFGSPNAAARLKTANSIARRALSRKYVIGEPETDVLVDEAIKEKK